MTHAQWFGEASEAFPTFYHFDPPDSPIMRVEPSIVKGNQREKTMNFEYLNTVAYTEHFFRNSGPCGKNSGDNTENYDYKGRIAQGGSKLIKCQTFEESGSKWITFRRSFLQLVKKSSLTCRTVGPRPVGDLPLDCELGR